MELWGVEEVIVDVGRTGSWLSPTTVPKYFISPDSGCS